jgi:predicted ATPase/class 3 adenylate cyclase/tRNA A-37 threonylcarbamoyl transferase component Bud32
VIYRATSAAGEPVVLKTLADRYPTRRAVAEIRHEYELMARLDLPGVMPVDALVEHGHGNLAIVMQPFGRSMATLLRERDGEPLPWPVFYDLALQTARILGDLHEARVVHKDVVPRNLLVDDAREVRLIDFGIASVLDAERQEAVLSRRLEGSLPYLSPEQTGRMNRDVDYRSDYYSLGVTLFELATGRLPFDATGILEWVHQHISQPPPDPRRLRADVPDALVAILATLLAKDATERYQSTFGLIADLERCRDAHAADGQVPAFPLSSASTSRRFEIPQRLFGRDQELARLLEAFADVAGGATRLATVHGFSGVGKSALVGELSRSIASEKGHLIRGKLDQFQRNTPYHAVASAFQQLFRQVLGESARTLAALRERIGLAVGPHGALLTALIPELELVVGPQPPVPELPPSEAQNRLQLVFVDFVRALAEDRPLVVFLDDLQWSDAPTLALLQTLLTARDLRQLMVIGAYRSNEVDDAHPLMRTLDAIAAARPILSIDLQPLAPPAVAALTAATLQASEERAAPLCAVVLDKTGGNPFFARAFLRSLHEQGTLRFAPGEGRWVWDLDAARAADVGDNVVAFMVSHLQRLPATTQRVLQLAACIGNTFDFDTLALVHDTSRELTREALDEALRLDMVVPLTEGYRYVALDAEGTGAAVNARYRFQHDRVQQAAYALVPDDQRAALRLQVGRLMRPQLDDHPERLLEIVGHLNEGRALLPPSAERLELVRLNLHAGRRARDASAHAFAHEHFTIGLELLDGLDGEDALRWALTEGLQESAYLTGRYDDADDLSARLLAMARSSTARAEVLATRTRQYATVGRMHDSIRAAIEGLNLLGMAFEEDPDADDLARELAAVDAGLAGRAIPDLLDAPACTDETQLIATRLLMEIFAAAFLSGSGTLFPYLVARLVNLSLVHGNSPESAFAYAAYGMILCGKLDDPAQGYAFGRLGVALNERFDDVALRSRVIYVYTMFVHHWTEPWATMTPWFQKGIEAGYQAGDLLYLAYSAQDCILWDPTLDLATASTQQRKYLSIVRDTGYRDSYDSGTLFLQLQLCLMGLTDGPTSMNTADFDEEATLRGMRDRGFMTGIANHHIYKAELHYTMGDIPGAMAHVVAQEELIASSMALPQIVRFTLTAFLVRTARLTSHPDDRDDLQPALDASLAQMRRWADHAPVNYLHLVRMMEGELHRLDGRLAPALAAFEEAVAHAAAHQYLRDGALANELAGTALGLAGLPKAAEGYIRAAVHGYEHYGATRKVLLLEQQHPWLAPAAPSLRLKTVSLSHTSGSMLGVELDMASVMKASRAISGQLVLEQLWSKTLDVLIENAGAQSGAFVLMDEGRLVLHAHRGDAAPVGLPRRLVPDDPVPVSLLRTVLRTREPVVLHDARTARAWRDDPYLRRDGPRSVLAIPIAHRDSFEGVIYLENRLTAEAFTEERIEVLKLLSAQAAISTENARLYEDQSRLVHAQRRFVPNQFLESLGHDDIATVELGESVAREMTVMFSDLRGFTPITERLGPQNVIALLNGYFSALEVPIAQSGGFIDSFNGDEIMALFGGLPDQAVRAGIGMWRALERFNAAAADTGRPVLKMGVGLNTGALVLGTVGGRDRLKCGVVGDPVNLASRIEQLTKHYDVPLLIGEATYQALTAPETLSMRLVDRVAVKGKTEGVRLYEVLDAETPARRDAKERTRDLLAEAHDLASRRRFHDAGERLQQALALDPDDRVLHILRERCERYAASPPPSTWNGVEALSHK